MTRVAIEVLACVVIGAIIAVGLIGIVAVATR